MQTFFIRIQFIDATGKLFSWTFREEAETEQEARDQAVLTFMSGMTRDEQELAIRSLDVISSATPGWCEENWPV